MLKCGGSETKLPRKVDKDLAGARKAVSPIVHEFAPEINGALPVLSSVINDRAEIIRRCLPDNESKTYWRKSLFKLARWCLRRDDGWEIFEDWYRLAGISVTREVAMEEFLVANSRANSAPRVDLAAVMARVQSKPLPQFIQDTFPAPRFQLVMAFCRELQADVFPAETFYLSCRDLARLIPDVSHRWANATLGVLVKQKILEIVEHGGPDKGRKATVYRYTGE